MSDLGGWLRLRELSEDIISLESTAVCRLGNPVDAANHAMSLDARRFFNPPLVRAQAFDRPPSVLGF